MSGERLLLEPDEWYACENPEREFDKRLTRFHIMPACRGCHVAAEAAVARGDERAIDVLAEIEKGWPAESINTVKMWLGPYGRHRRSEP